MSSRLNSSRAPRPAASSRRRFLLDSGRTIGSVTLISLGIGLYSEQSLSLPADRLRPPGAVPESDFSAACIRCGLCVRSCPFDIISLATPASRTTTGTPYFVARDLPCEMCDDIPCVNACPSGALDHNLKDIDDARMGLAVLMDHENCLNFQGLRCDVCFRVCPAIDEAITLEPVSNQRTGKHALFIPTVHSDHCTGCGKCEHACVLDEAAIKVLPLKLARGQLGQHYRLGWKEKQKAGGSLVTPDPAHSYNLPPGQSYRYDGIGQKLDQSSLGVTPFADNPLDTLNQKGGAGE